MLFLSSNTFQFIILSIKSSKRKILCFTLRPNILFCLAIFLRVEKTWLIICCVLVAIEVMCLCLILFDLLTVTQRNKIVNRTISNNKDPYNIFITQMLSFFHCRKFTPWIWDTAHWTWFLRSGQFHGFFFHHVKLFISKESVQSRMQISLKDWLQHYCPFSN